VGTGGGELIDALNPRTIADKARRNGAAAQSRGLAVRGEPPATVQSDHVAVSRFYAEIEGIQQTFMSATVGDAPKLPVYCNI
jgi:hypothetical protein